MGGGEPLRAKVRLVEPAAFTKVSALGVEEQRVNVVADLLTPPDQRRNVGDAFRVEARIIVWEARDALKVPAGALFRKGEQWAAFIIADGRARLRIVKAGPLQRDRDPSAGGPQARRRSHLVSRQPRAGRPAGDPGHTLT